MVVDFISQYHTLAKFEINEVIPFINLPGRKCYYIPDIITEEDGSEYTIGTKQYIVKINSFRYKVFEQSLDCYNCKIKGSFFYLQQHKKMNKITKDNVAHFNLYAEDSLNINGGNLILMTQDHLFPKAKGGKDTLDNLKTMCAICNYNKADSIL